MILSQFCAASLVSVVAGLDRTASLQLMVCRPIVAAPVTGWLIGVPVVGLEVGLLVELLWLCFLPVGSAIPPDDTQVSIAATLLGGMGNFFGEPGSLSLVVMAVFCCCPLGKVGQIFDGWVRQFNGRLADAAHRAVAQGHLKMIGTSHLKGLFAFGLASWFSFLVIALSGAGLLYMFFVILKMGQSLEPVAGFLRILFPLVGAAAILSNLKLRRSVTLFLASFVSTLMLLWAF